jgi:hypothetical protein
MSKASDIGKKFGESVDNFTTASQNTIESILMTFANDSINLMKKHIQEKARTKGASTLAESMVSEPYEDADGVGIYIRSSAKYWKYVNDGVKGVKNKKKAPKSKFKFKNLGVPKEMWKSFMSYVARSGTKEVRGITTSRKGKTKIQGIKDNIKVAKGLAVATKIGGIAPMQFKQQADNKERRDKLKKELSQAIGSAMKYNIIKSVKKDK